MAFEPAPMESAPSVAPVTYDRDAALRHLQQERLKKAQAQEQARPKVQPETPKTEMTRGQTLSPETQALRQTAVYQFIEEWLGDNMITHDSKRWERHQVQGGIDFAVGMQENVKATIEATGHTPRLDLLLDTTLQKLSEAKVAATSPVEKQSYDKKREDLKGMWRGMLGELAVANELDGFGDDVLISAESFNKKELDQKSVDQLYFRYTGIKTDENGNQYHALEMIGVQVKCRQALTGAVITDLCQVDETGERPGVKAIYADIDNKINRTRRGWTRIRDEKRGYIDRAIWKYEKLVARTQAVMDGTPTTDGLPIKVEPHYLLMELHASDIDSRTGQFRDTITGRIRNEAMPALLGDDGHDRMYIWRQNR